MATPAAVHRAAAPWASGSGAASGASPPPAGAGRANPSTAKPTIEPILTTVRRFCTQAPSWRPSQLMPVRSAMAPAAATWPPLIRQVQPPRGTARRTCAVEAAGTKLPRYSPKPTAMAAMPPDMMTRKAVQP